MENIVDEVVKKIKEMEDGASSSIYKLIDNKENLNLFEVQDKVVEKLKKEGITLDYSEYEGMYVGLPYMINFVKRGKDVNINSNNYILKVEHIPFHGAYGLAHELKTPEPIIEEIPLIPNETIDIGDVKLKVISVNDESLELLLPSSQGVFHSYKEYQKGNDEKITLKLNRRTRINRDVLDCMEYWNITFKLKDNKGINHSIISFKIRTNDNSYQLEVEAKNEKSFVTFTDSNNKVYNSNLNELMYKEFKTKYMEFTSNWETEYFSGYNRNINWGLVEIQNGEYIKEYRGANTYPDNWNEFLEFLIFYEKLCKIDTSKESSKVE